MFQSRITQFLSRVLLASVFALTLFGTAQYARAEHAQRVWNGTGPLVVNNADGSQFLLPGIVWIIGGDSVAIFSIERLNEAGEPGAPTTLRAYQEIQLEGEITMEAGSLVSQPVIVTDGLLWNTAEHPVRLLIDDGIQLRFMTLQWGEGIAVGSSTEGSPTHKRGCVCVCTTTNGTHVTTSLCPPNPPEGDQTLCRCGNYNSQPCVVQEPDPDNTENTILVIGTLSGCDEGQIPN